MELSWNFYKVILQRQTSFQGRQLELIERFLAADTYLRRWRGTDYRYQLYDVSAVCLTGHQVVYGHLTRSPKVAHGRALDERTKRSEESAVNVPEIADYTEFIYDLDSCVLAVRRRAPFTSAGAVSTAWRQLLGLPVEAPGNQRQTDVHVEVMRDSREALTLLDQDLPLTEAKLTYVKPNPAGDDSLETITLGLLGEEMAADEVKLEAKKVGGGTLDKRPNGFIRRSIAPLMERGYLKRGVLHIGSRDVDLLKEKEKQRETPGYAKDANGRTLPLWMLVARWIERLVTNRDIYRSVDHGDE